MKIVSSSSYGAWERDSSVQYELYSWFVAMHMDLDVVCLYSAYVMLKLIL